jgi:DNA-binding GntR family transcriptional regulator
MTVDRQSLSDQIRQVLIDRIVSGELKPGERLVELALAKEFQTSQTPVREALQSLEAMRLVEALPHRGVRVREVTEKEMAETYALRGLLEEFAAPLATANLRGEVTHLQHHAEAIQSAAEQGDTAAYAQHDFTFHREIVEASGNTTLLYLWDALAFEFRTPLLMVRHAPNLIALAADHFSILEAMVAGDRIRAGRLLREHSVSLLSQMPTEQTHQTGE